MSSRDGMLWAIKEAILRTTGRDLADLFVYQIEELDEQAGQILAAVEPLIRADERARIAAAMACTDGCQTDSGASSSRTDELLAKTKRAAENPDRTEEVRRAFEAVERSRKQQTAAMIRRLKRRQP